MERLKKIISSSRGYSIAEFMVAAGVSFLVSIIAGTSFVLAMETYQRMIRQYEAETEMVSAMLAIKSALSTSVQVTYGGNVSVANNAFTTRGSAVPQNITTGRVMTGNFNTGTAGDASLIAMTIKEMNVVANRSELFASALYYQRPTDATSGALYIDQERNPGGWTRLSPVNAPFMYTRFVEFEVLNPRVVAAPQVPAIDPLNTDVANSQVGNIKVGNPAIDINKVLVSVEFRLMMRYFTSGEPRNFLWRPFVDLTPAQIGTMARHYDMEKRLQVNFVNNALDRNRYLAPRVLGNVHLFRLSTGLVRR